MDPHTQRRWQCWSVTWKPPCIRTFKQPIFQCSQTPWSHFPSPTKPRLHLNILYTFGKGILKGMAHITHKRPVHTHSGKLDVMEENQIDRPIINEIRKAALANERCLPAANRTKIKKPPLPIHRSQHLNQTTSSSPAWSGNRASTTSCELAPCHKQPLSEQSKMTAFGWYDVITWVRGLKAGQHSRHLKYDEHQHMNWILQTTSQQIGPRRVRLTEWLAGLYTYHARNIRHSTNKISS